MLTSLLHSRRSSYKPPVPGGFTLVELLVVMGIVFIITTFVLVQHTKFDSVTLLRSLTYNIALSVREAQVFGTSVLGFSSGATTAFGSGYGVHFISSNEPSPAYFLFADLREGSAPGDGAYDAGEELPAYKLGRGYKYRRLCALSGSTLYCSNTNPVVTTLSIVFRRPDPDACISTNLAPAACAPGAAPVYSAAYIEVQPVSGATWRSIKVTSTGQIVVCPASIADLATC